MRHISLRVTRLLVNTRVTPNSLTYLMIVVGVIGAATLLIPGIAGALIAALLVQAYLLLDCSDGELARWRQQTSTTGVYLDRVGHYMVEAALFVGVGFRAGQLRPDGWAVLGCVAALGVVLIKSETDLVDVARARDGKLAVEDEASVPRSAGVASARRLASAFKFHRLIGGIEASLVIVIAAVVDLILGGVPATRVLVAVFAAIALLQLVLHLASILMSNRLR
jgi:phosphatidylglycerophosphate synthase